MYPTSGSHFAVFKRPKSREPSKAQPGFELAHLRLAFRLGSLDPSATLRGFVALYAPSGMYRCVSSADPHGVIMRITQLYNLSTISQHFS